jgi:hypothetical protein
VYWKVYSISSGLTLKAGFPSEEAAKAWLEVNRPGREENYLAEEMDDDEIEQWKLDHEEEEGDDLSKPAVEATEDDDDDEFERGRYSYSTDDDDVGERDEDLLSEVEDDD